MGLVLLSLGLFVVALQRGPNQAAGSKNSTHDLTPSGVEAYFMVDSDKHFAEFLGFFPNQEQSIPNVSTFRSSGYSLSFLYQYGLSEDFNVFLKLSPVGEITTRGGGTSSKQTGFSDPILGVVGKMDQVYYRLQVSPSSGDSEPTNRKRGALWSRVELSYLNQEGRYFYGPIAGVDYTGTARQTDQGVVTETRVRQNIFLGVIGEFVKPKLRAGIQALLISHGRWGSSDNAGNSLEVREATSGYYRLYGRVETKPNRFVIFGLEGFFLPYRPDTDLGSRLEVNEATGWVGYRMLF